MVREPTIVLLPGLGADHRLFAAQQASLPNVVVPALPDIEAGESLPAFAKRVAGAIPQAESLYLGGSSFGGMVALEVASLLRPRSVVLIGSCRSPGALTPLARAAGALLPVVPTRLFRPRRWLVGLAVLGFGRLSPDQRALFFSMASGKAPSALKWGLRAILSWRPTPVAAPVRHIHGADDRVIPVGRVKPDRVVPGAGHFLAITHAAEVNAFILDVVANGTGA